MSSSRAPTIHLLKGFGVVSQRRLVQISKKSFFGARLDIFLIQLLPHTHIQLFYWVFVPLIQNALANFRQWWNNHRIRIQNNKLMPSGHVPSFALEYPSALKGIDCQIKIPKEVIEQLRKFLEEETHVSRQECFRWYTEEFGEDASAAWQTIGKPSINLDTAWDVFSQIASIVT
ncbi:hypothetical protein F5880DRAFT_1511191 [Lentinula raphanica]|nr:hypothetical protein F5880DRAFT_1511191 [Lentinula raphanica]